MKIILTNTQLQELTNKIDSENLHEALQFQKRICDATFNCFIQEKNEQKKYLKQLIEENFISLGYSKKKLIEYRTRVSEKLLIENTEDIKTITNTHFLNLEKFIKEQEETQPEAEEPKEQIDTTTNPQYDFKLYFEDGKKKYAWKLKNTEQWYDAEGELSKEIEKRIPFNSAPSATQQTLSDEQVAEKIKKNRF